MIRVAVTNLGKYTEGQLVDQWLNLPATDEEIQQVKNAIGINKEYEEIFLPDYKTDIKGLEIGEHQNLEELNELAKRYEALDEGEQDAVKAIIEADYNSLEVTLRIVEAGVYSFYSECKNLTDLARHMVNNGCFGDIRKMSNLMGNLAEYIDYERLGREFGLNGYTVTSYGVILIN